MDAAHCTGDNEEKVKIAIRLALLALGAGLVFFGLHRAHSEAMNLQNNPVVPGSTYSPEILAVAGAFLVLAAFAPSPATLGRWMLRKRRRPVPHTRFRRRNRG